MNTNTFELISTPNDDLCWDLSMFERRQTAIEFIQGFKSRLPVYSPFVKQLYTSYTVHFPSDVRRSLVILPNQHAYHDTFNGIPENSISPTGLSIFPKLINGESVICLRIPLGNRERDVPLEYGINIIKNNRTDGSPFLPVISKGDLRNLDVHTPCLHLHNLSPALLSGLSKFEVDVLKRTIQSNIDRMARDLSRNRGRVPLS